jgi:uncharacterized protein (DUF1778 family)
MVMPQKAIENSRMSLRVKASDKAVLLRAVALRQTDLTDFVISTALEAAKAIVAEAERLDLSERDSRRVLELLDNPPTANEKLRRAARALPALR